MRAGEDLKPDYDPYVSASSAQLMVDVLPGFASELRDSLLQDGRAELAGQVSSLRIIQLCGCDDDFCASFYTEPPPNGGWGEGHENVIPGVDSGMVVLDVVDGMIRYVEVLDRDDVRRVFFSAT